MSRVVIVDMNTAVYRVHIYRHVMCVPVVITMAFRGHLKLLFISETQNRGKALRRTQADGRMQ